MSGMKNILYSSQVCVVFVSIKFRENMRSLPEYYDLVLKFKIALSEHLAVCF